MRIVGYDTFITLVKAAYALRLVGVPSSHVLVISPPGTGKTSIAKLFSKSVNATFVRTTGRYDMLPEDFISEKEIVYNDGKPEIVWKLKAVGKLLATSNARPAVWFFDEFDKMNRKSMMSLLELMEEQQVTLPSGETHKLNFMLIAAGNSRKYDKDASPIPRSVRDRFIVYWELGYLPIDLEMNVLEEGIKQMLGIDVNPSDQFSFTFDRKLFEKNLAEVKKRYGECFVRAVSHIRTHKLVEEPPGPRAYIHATLLTASLATIVKNTLHNIARLGFKAAVAGKITVSPDSSPFEICEEAFEKYCVDREGEERKEYEYEDTGIGQPNNTSSTSARIKALLNSSGKSSKSSGRDKSYSLTDISRYLDMLGDKVVMTSKGAMPAKVVSRLLLSGSITDIVVPGGPTLKVVGSSVLSTHKLSFKGIGRDEGELTYSKREIDMIKIADVLALTGMEMSKLAHLNLSDPGDILAKVLDAVSKKKSSPIYPQLKSALKNLIDILGDVVSSKEGDRTDTLSSQVKRFSKTGEFEELSEHERHRLHITRTLMRMEMGIARPVYKSFMEMGRRYTIVFDKSGSMSDKYINTTKKAIGALLVCLIAKTDYEAKFNLVVFDSSAKIVVRDGDYDQLIDALLELEPSGGTHYPSAMVAASNIMNEGDILIIVGDFIDTSQIPRNVSSSIRMKASSVILVPTGESDEDYAEYIAHELNGKIYVYENGVFKYKQSLSH
ncbi:MAG: AAA family ATPase [Desulfurococcaceae archaeon]